MKTIGLGRTVQFSKGEGVSQVEAVGRGREVKVTTEEIFKKDDLARLLKICTKTVDRRRILEDVYRPDYIDETGHPIWEAPKVQEILAREKKKARR